MAAWEAGFISYHAAGRSPQCGQPPQVPGPSLLPSHSLLPPRTPGQTDMGQGTLDSFPRAEQVWPLFRGCLEQKLPVIVYPRANLPLWAYRQGPLSLNLFHISGQGCTWEKNSQVFGGYLVQLVHWGADGAELAVWNTTNGKHSI